MQGLDFSYDTAGLVALHDGAGTTSLYYDHRGLLTRVTDPLGHSTVQQFDRDYRLTSIVAPSGETQAFTWFAFGGLKSLTDELGHTTSFAYDDPFKLLTSFTDARGNTTKYIYDDVGNLRLTGNLNQSAETLGDYTPQGLPQTYTNRRGQPMGFEFNAAGLLTWQSLADGSVIEFDSDASGNLIRTIGGSDVTTYEYDFAQSGDRLRKVTDSNGRFLEYAYDEFGRRISMTDQDGFATRYEYDAAGRLSRLRDGEDELLVTYNYEPTGRLSRIDKGNGTFTTYAYDAAGQLLSLVNHRDETAINSRFDYTYDSRGRRTSMSMLDGNWTYSYDTTGQLTRAVFFSNDPTAILDQDLQYEYDAVGNRIRTIINGITTEYTTNNLNQYTSVGDVAYTYDADGNLTFDGERTYEYDQHNRLIRATGPDGVAEYEYDVLGNRTATVHNGQRVEFLLDPTGLGHVVAEYDALGARATSYVNGLGLAAAFRSSEWLHYDFDALGSTAGISNAAGTYINRYDYEPFGTSLFSTETVANSFEFIGQFGVTAEERGLQFMRARYYQAMTGRFSSPDPIGLLGGQQNFYAYVSNAPTQFVDPSGLLSSGEVGLAVGVGLILVAQAPAVASALAASYTFQALIHATYTFGSMYATNPLFRKGVDYAAKELLRRIPSIPPSQTQSPTTVNAIDPNDKLAPSGFGEFSFVRGDDLLPYHIRFENVGPATENPATGEPFDEDLWATAPAQRVTITDQLSSDLDWSTFRLTEMGFGDTIVSIPSNSQHFETTVSVTYDDKSFEVQLFAGIDLFTGLVYATFQTLDAATGLPPDVLTGFLLPEDGTGRGKGYFAFTIRPRIGLPTGTELKNVALISFDGQTLIATNQADPFDPTSAVTDPAHLDYGRLNARNTIDVGSPASAVDPLPPSLVNANFLVSWSGQDDLGGSGIGSFDIFVSIDGGPFNIWVAGTTETSAVYTPQLGTHAYAFYSIARDNVGHVEAAPTVPDATIMVEAANASPLLEPISAQTVNEGALLTLQIVASDLDINQTLTFSLAPDAPDGAQIDPVTGEFTWTPADSGAPLPITVIVTDDGPGALSAQATFFVTVTNAAPVTSITGPISGVPGQPRIFTLSADDPSPVDQSAGFVFDIDWDGNGTVDQTVSGASGIEVSHMYPTTGTFIPKVVARDKDNDTGPSAQHSINITRFTLQARDGNPSIVDLAYGGMQGTDIVAFIGNGTSVNVIQILVNGIFSLSSRTFQGITGKVIAYGQGGDDFMWVENVPGGSELYGGDGNDVLWGRTGENLLDGGDGNDLLIGSAGADTLLGGSGRDLLYGGGGVNVLNGGSGQDLILAGVVHDLSVEDGMAIRDEWASGRTLPARMANISGTGAGPRVNGHAFLKVNETILDDESVDRIIGGEGEDWLFGDPNEDVFEDLDVAEDLVTSLVP